jgi:putative toxin-antitoxin system antitoxin component (TIGR02293 family)
MKHAPLPKSRSRTPRPRAAGVVAGRHRREGTRAAGKPSRGVVRSFAELRRARSPDERHALVVGASIPSAIVVEASEALGVPQSEVIDALRMRGATFYRWLQKGQPIAPDKNEPLVRLAEFAELAAGAFGDEAKGRRWLAAPNAALGGAAPLRLLASAYGAERVRRALSVIEYGGVA